MDFITLLRTSTVDEAMTREPLCVEPTTPMSQVLLALQERRTGAVIVCHGGKVCGIFTERDFLKHVNDDGSFEEPVSQFMVKDPVVFPTKATLAEAIRKMSLGGYRHLPIVDDQSRPIGMLKVKNVVHFLVEHLSRAVYNATPEVPLVGREGA